MVGNWAGNYSIWRVYDLYNELSKASIVYLQAEFDNIKQTNIRLGSILTNSL